MPIVKRAQASDRLALVIMDNIIHQIWELGSWNGRKRRDKKAKAAHQGRHQLIDFSIQEQQASDSWLCDEVGHRKALFDRIGGYGRQG